MAHTRTRRFDKTARQEVSSGTLEEERPRSVQSVRARRGHRKSFSEGPASHASPPQSTILGREEDLDYHERLPPARWYLDPRRWKKLSTASSDRTSSLDGIFLSQARKDVSVWGLWMSRGPYLVWCLIIGSVVFGSFAWAFLPVNSSDEVCLASIAPRALV